MVAKPTDRQFQGTDPNTLHAFPGEVVFVGHAMKVRITAIPKVKTLQNALSNFSLRLAAPPPVFAADVGVARQMYFAALQLAQVSQKRRAFGRRRRPIDMDAVSRQDRSLRVVLNDEPEERVVKIEHLLQRRGAVVVEVRSRP